MAAPTSQDLIWYLLRVMAAFYLVRMHFLFRLTAFCVLLAKSLVFSLVLCLILHLLVEGEKFQQTWYYVTLEIITQHIIMLAVKSFIVRIFLHFRTVTF